MRSVTVCILLFLSTNIFKISAKDISIDSIYNKMNNAQNEIEEIEALLSIADYYTEVNEDSAYYYLEKSYYKSKKINYTSGLFDYYLIKSKYYQLKDIHYKALENCDLAAKYLSDLEDDSKAITYNIMRGKTLVDSGLYDDGIECFNKGLELNKNVGNELSHATLISNLASAYESKSEYYLALEKYFEALNLYEKLNYRGAMAVQYNNIAKLNSVIGNNDKSIEYYLKAIQINKELNQIYNLCMNYNNLSIVYNDVKEYDKAIAVLTTSIAEAEKAGYDYSLAQAYHNMGIAFFGQKKYTHAIESYTHSYNICLNNKIQIGILYNTMSLGRTYLELKQYDRAEINFNYALKLLSTVAVANENIISLYENLYRLYEEQGKFELALNYYKKYENFQDSILSLEKSNMVNELQEKYETEKKQKENERLLLKNELATKKLQNKNLVILTILVSLIFMIALSVVLIISKNRKQDKIKLLTSKNSEIESQSNELKMLNATKDKLFSIIAHDLRNPFNSLIGFSTLLREDIIDKDFSSVEMYADQLLENSTKGYNLLENLLHWSRAQRGEISFDLEFINIYILAKESINLLIESANLKHIRISNKIDPNLTIEVDQNMMLVVFRNLISNAIKFTYENGTIFLNSKIENDMAIISVKDNGCGIINGKRESLFEIGNNITTQGTNNEKGSGLGLILCKEFVEKHGGEIWVESQLGEGSEFFFSIPFKS